MQLKSYLQGEWVGGSGRTQELFNPATEELLAQTCVDGLDLAAGVTYAREQGGQALRAMTLRERGGLLSDMAKRIHEHRDELIGLSVANGGNTRGDAKFDLDGASGTLAHYATLSESLEGHFVCDGESIAIGSSPRMSGRHVYVPRPGVALLINAFNFPAWGFGGKAACALLAGVPVVLKPATSTAVVAHRMVELIADVVPTGAVSCVTGSAHSLPSLLTDQDVISFTGSGDTALKLRGLESVRSGAVRLNVEADSLNVAVLGPDVDDDTYDAFVRNVVKEMTQKAGQKCTAIRRIFVPRDAIERVRDDLIDRLGQIKVGDPAEEGVRMGPVTSAAQLRDVRAGIDRLKGGAKMLLGSEGVPDKGYFVPVTLFEADDPSLAAVHEHEVFGPVATLLPTDGSVEQVAPLVARGRGALVGSVYSDDRDYAAAMFAALAPYHGRLNFGSKKVAEKAPSPGTVLPHFVHGGPGRAGDGEELGGLRGLALYSQRLAVQGDRALIDKMLA